MLRQARNEAHKAFDPLWKNKLAFRRRCDAYSWLAMKMGLRKKETHIAKFDLEQCKEVVRLCRSDISMNQ